MASLADIRAALAAAVKDGVDLDMQVSPYMLAKPSPPCAQIVPGETEYHKAFGNGIENWTLLVQVMVALGSDQGAQQLLDEMLKSSGSVSVKAAIEADMRLGGTVASAIVSKTSGYTTYRLPATQAEALGAEWTVDIQASGI